eukprot:gene8268-biopygen14588
MHHKVRIAGVHSVPPPFRAFDARDHPLSFIRHGLCAFWAKGYKYRPDGVCQTFEAVLDGLSAFALDDENSHGVKAAFPVIRSDREHWQLPSEE